ncbi:hypothetical protein [Reyranella soli]|uniref:hypothetical protein n=1 Tax=Reyranella soli TaxID=1230389 RepID=UPI0014783334|nr:hypothetical protein [Reyranella soli]
MVRSRLERSNDVAHAPEVVGPRIGGGFNSKYLSDTAETVRVCRTKRPLAESVFVNHGAARNTERGRRDVRFLTLWAKARAMRSTAAALPAGDAGIVQPHRCASDSRRCHSKHANKLKVDLRR